jgi:hypothetical protein
MTCSDYGELISAYIDDELSKKEVKLLLHHLEKCSACEEELSSYLLQGEKVAALRAAYSGPIPEVAFPQTIMTHVRKEHIAPASDRFHWSISDFFQGLLYPLRRPAFVMSFSLIAFLGLLVSVYLNISPSQDNKKDQLMSVYELPTHKTPAKSVKVADLGTEEDSTVFHHVAYSSAETFATKPSLLEYAAYTPGSR